MLLRYLNLSEISYGELDYQSTKDTNYEALKFWLKIELLALFTLDVSILASVAMLVNTLHMFAHAH